MNHGRPMQVSVARRHQAVLLQMSTTCRENIAKIFTCAWNRPIKFQATAHCLLPCPLGIKRFSFMLWVLRGQTRWAPVLVSSWQTMTRNFKAAEMKDDMAEEWSTTVLRAWVRDTNLLTLSTGWAVGSFRPGDRHRLARDGSRSQCFPQACQTHQPLPPAILCNHIDIVTSACVPRVWIAFVKASCRPDPLIP